MRKKGLLEWPFCREEKKRSNYREGQDPRERVATTERREGEECGGRSGARGAVGGAARREACRDDRSDRARRAATTGAPSPSERVAATIGVLIDMFFASGGCVFVRILSAFTRAP